MKQWYRLAIYLLLNVVISASTTFLVLLAWDRTHPPVTGGLIPLSVKAPLRPQTTELAESSEPTTPQPTPTRTFIAYQVQDGDTFDSIAQAYGISAEELMAENGFTEKVVGAGEVLRIPLPSQSTQSASVRLDSVMGVGDLNTERVFLRHTGFGEVPLAGWKIEDERGHVYTFPELTLFGEGGVNVYTKAGSNTVVDLFWGLDRAVWQSGVKVILRDAQGNVRDTYNIP